MDSFYTVVVIQLFLSFYNLFLRAEVYVMCGLAYLWCYSNL